MNIEKRYNKLKKNTHELNFPVTVKFRNIVKLKFTNELLVESANTLIIHSIHLR